MNREVSRKLSYLYLVMTGMIIGIHSVSTASLGFTGISMVVNDYVRIFYDAATGSFFFFSAFLLYRRERNYVELLRNKINTLLIPYLIFNVIAFLYKDVFRNLVLYHTVFTYGARELLYDILMAGANPPMWFIRVLFEFIVIYPIIKKVIASKKIAGGGYNRFICFSLIYWS